MMNEVLKKNTLALDDYYQCKKSELAHNLNPNIINYNVATKKFSNPTTQTIKKKFILEKIDFLMHDKWGDMNSKMSPLKPEPETLSHMEIESVNEN